MMHTRDKRAKESLGDKSEEEKERNKEEENNKLSVVCGGLMGIFITLVLQHNNKTCSTIALPNSHHYRLATYANV